MKNANERTLEVLVRNNARVFIRLADAETAERFTADAEREGFMFGDGARPSERKPEGIIAIHADRTLSYVGFIGHMAFGAASPGLLRVDYRRYIAGEDDRFDPPKSGLRTGR